MICYEKIPKELTDLKQWVLWKLEVSGKGKNTKVPYSVSGWRVSSTNPAAWSSFTEAKEKEATADGIGFMFLSGGNLSGIDLDHCIHTENGVEILHPEAKRIVEILDSYTERSPSGDGLHIFVRGTKNTSECKTNNTPWGGAFECYDHARYFTVTGNVYRDTQIQNRQKELDELLSIYLPVAEKQTASTGETTEMLEDKRILELATRAKNGDKIKALWDGDATGYSSPSEADLALMVLLAFYTQDRKQLARLLRASGIYREKHDREDYVQKTLDKALSGCKEHYTPVVETGFNDNRETSLERSPFPEPPDPIVYRGVVGDIVKLIEPHTESDPVGIQIQILTAIGNVVGRSVWFVVEDTKHHGNLYPVIVAFSSTGRKGTGLSRAKMAVSDIDKDWLDKRWVSGLSSSEGLLWAVRDPIFGKDKKGNTITTDDGVGDKRLIVVESEFASVLNQFSRTGNTLSPILRDAWDGKEVLQTLTKNSPAKSTGAHISIIGHITHADIEQSLARCEMQNGFGNRCLWFSTKRSKLLPNGGSVPKDELARLSGILARNINLVKGAERIDRDANAQRLWNGLYYSLEEERSGLVGALSSRAAAQVTRLSLIYAISEGKVEIAEEHLLAATGLWEYSLASIRHIFGSRTGDRATDEIEKRLIQAGTKGLTRTEIHTLLGGHTGQKEIQSALERLQLAGKARMEKGQTAGRPTETWFST